ncbi:hypothetical protein U0070_003127 [Myodes glareolus]|uniref:Uncharacterized protein n=1 Tax=Myodes glareolus TaxID=447135 RepID=A0AAW0HEF9_MYOGA
MEEWKTKNQIVLFVKFLSRFLHPTEATLLLISKPKSGVGGSTMAFALKGEVLNFKAIDILKCKSPCYQWKEVSVNVKNPFSVGGDFRVILVESTTLMYLPSQVTGSSKAAVIPDRGKDSDYGVDRSSSHAENGLRTSIKSNFIREFFCSLPTIFLEAKGSSSLEIYYLPFDMHVRYCAVILSNKEIGDLIYIVEGKGLIPLPSNFLSMKPPSPIDYNISLEEEYNKEDPVLYLSCKPHQILDMDLKVPLTNEAKEKALAFAAQQQMSTLEYERRAITGTLESSTIRVAIALLGLTKIEGKLTFENEVDGMAHSIEIDGIGTKPLALDHIVIDCKVGNVTDKSIIVPNYTKSLLTFKNLTAQFHTLSMYALGNVENSEVLNAQ